MKNICRNCLGCNLLLDPMFHGKEECINFCKANETGLDMCKKILDRKQIKMKEVKR